MEASELQYMVKVDYTKDVPEISFTFNESTIYLPDMLSFNEANISIYILMFAKQII